MGLESRALLHKASTGLLSSQLGPKLRSDKDGRARLPIHDEYARDWETFDILT